MIATRRCDRLLVDRLRIYGAVYTASRRVQHNLEQPPVNIAPFALPRCAPGEIRFEEPRDIVRVVVAFRGQAPTKIGLHYLRKLWPKTRFERARDTINPFTFGWSAIDDWFNCEWQPAAVRVKRLTAAKVELTFAGLSKEFGKDYADYDVRFRRTLGLRVQAPTPEKIAGFEVHTASADTTSHLRVELHAGKRTRGKTIAVTGYNARLLGNSGTMRINGKRSTFFLRVAHMTPAHFYCGDNGLLTFQLDHDAFTISLQDLHTRGPIWNAEEGVFVARADDPMDFAAYLERIKGRKTIAARVKEREEQSYGGAFNGQPRPHAENYNIGCKHARQRFWIEKNGDVLLHKYNVDCVPGADTARYKNKGNARFFFGLEKWTITARYNDPAPVLVYNLHAKRGAVLVEQRSLAVPLLRDINDGPGRPDEPIVALIRFRFRNNGDAASEAALCLRYSQDSHRSMHAYYHRPSQDGNLVPRSAMDALAVSSNALHSDYEGVPVLRAAFQTTMRCQARDGAAVFSQWLQPGQSCDLLLAIPHIELTDRGELAALRALDFDRCHAAVARFWREEAARGATLHTPVDQLNTGHAAHLSHVQITDFAMPDDPDLINTSVGTSTYGNFTNESCMIIQELEQRGLAEECRRRLDLWVKYQGTAEQPGNFTDYNGMFYGAGGFECGAYNQHHGWALWALAEHFLLTGDKTWFDRVADALVAGADWVFRQRRETMRPLPHSRGWEYGFLPAGSLEDVTDFWYWLSTNSLTWRGVDAAARALAAAGHAAAARIRREANAYRRDLIRGFETMRQHSPLVPLRDGRWAPHYPSRLYCRGRDLGWIRETLEGSIYLLLSGLYDSRSKQAGWILDDYQDNRYVTPPYGYPIVDFDSTFFNVAGFSCQPNLLAGLLPYLDRDEPELYIWMFFNAWVACYRDEINGMTEHPAPVLGFSNVATFKTSDEANAIMWLRYMLIYATDDALYLGRAMPRAWLAAEEPVVLERVVTRFGRVSVRYESAANARAVTLTAQLDLRHDPARLIGRIRPPHAQPIQAVTVNGKRHTAFDAKRGDIDLTGLRGRVVVAATY